MPMHASKRSSTGTRDIHRELERRRNLAGVKNGGIAKESSAVRNGGIAKKSSAAPLQQRASAIRQAPGAVLPPGSTSASVSQPPRRELPPAVPPSSAVTRSLNRGTTVLMRTKVGTMLTGHCVLLWLSAVVVSVAEDGYLEVVYNGNFPIDDPFRAVRVARDHVKNMPPQ